MKDKDEIADYIWTVSRYYGNLLGDCESVYRDEYFIIASTQLLLLCENICRYKANDYERQSCEVYDKLLKDKIINKIEFELLSGKNSLRQIRNFLVHKNQSKYNFIVLEEKKEILYPFSEQETWKWFYDTYSPILFSILYNLLCDTILNFSKINLDVEILETKLVLKLLSPREIMLLKGYDDTVISKVFDENLIESQQYNVAENASDINILSMIYNSLLK